jgi:hypothetical protein
MGTLRMERVEKKPLIKLRVENGQPITQPGIKFYDNKNFQAILPQAASLMEKKMNEVNWRNTPWEYNECEMTLKERFERSNHHTPAIAYEKEDGSLKSIIFPLSWKCPTFREEMRIFLDKSRTPWSAIREKTHNYIYTIRHEKSEPGGRMLARLRHEVNGFLGEIREPSTIIISVFHEGVLTLWHRMPSTWKMGFDDPWKSDRPDGLQIYCPQVFADGGPREVIHGGIIPVLIGKMMQSKHALGVAYSRFSDFAKFVQNQKMSPKQYLYGVTEGIYPDRIIRMHSNYGAVPRKIFRNGCDDPHSLNYSVLMDYTTLAVFIAASLNDPIISMKIIKNFGKRYGKVVKCALNLHGEHVTTETDPNGTSYTIDYSSFLHMMKNGYSQRPAKARS